MQKMIYILEDEADILELLSLQLSNAGFRTRGFMRAEAMLYSLNQEIPDLIVLDLMLPDLDGLEVCKRLKETPALERIPVVMLTARINIEDRIKGLDYGADDYITKPFDSKELLARINAVLRRSGWETEKNVLLITPEFKLDFNRFEVFMKNKRLDLTLTEFKILQLLTKRPGWVYSRSQILDHLWGTDKIVIERSVDVHVKNLRDKIAPYDKMVVNVRGVGYKFDPDWERNVPPADA
ncbi:MAG: response regulator transcription factor [Candidatus Cloacimonetes bacterium]|nr:response regulator transcription factor [Candidatus Cloacimonadota bacterium]